MTRILSTTLFRLSLLYVVVVAVSFALSQLLPSFQDIAPTRDEHCYWTNAMLVFVECGSDVFAGSAKEPFYNFWLFLIYAPMFLSWKALLIYAPIGFIFFRLMPAVRNQP
jgi:hypothetical protein